MSTGWVIEASSNAQDSRTAIGMPEAFQRRQRSRRGLRLRVLAISITILDRQQEHALESLQALYGFFNVAKLSDKVAVLIETAPQVFEGVSEPEAYMLLWGEHGSNHVGCPHAATFIVVWIAHKVIEF